MDKSKKTLSAYHGPGFQKRTQADSFLNATDSEYKKLKAVLLYCPGNELKKVKNPDSVQHIEKIDSKKIKQEYKNIENAFKKNGIAVHYIKKEFLQREPPPNLMFVRDLFWNGKNGFVISRMGSTVRAGEEFFAAATLSSMQIPVILGIHNKGLFEGADLLWLNPKTLLCGIGNRTNKEGFLQLKNLLAENNIKVVPVRLPKKVQHLLGLLQIIDRKKALLRKSIAPLSLHKILTKEKFKIIELPEIDEVTKKQGMNIVTLAPSQIMMPANCPTLKKIYLDNKIKILAEVNIDEITKAAGGLACATGILSRELNHE